MTYARENLEALLELQKCDMQLERDRRTLAEAKSGVALAPLSEQLAEWESRVGDLCQRIGRMRRDLRYAEQETRSLRDDIAANERKLYGGLVRNPKEADKMQQHVAGLRRRVDLEEEKALALMMEIESIESDLAAAREQAAALGGELRTLETKLAETITDLTREIPRLEERRQAVAAALPQPLLTAYEGLRSRRGVGVVAAIRDGKCEGCRMGLPFLTVREVRSGELRTCDNCGRILVEL